MIILPSLLEKALGNFQGRFLLACLSTGFEPTIVYAAGSQMQLANLYRAMGSNRGHCLGACTTGAAAPHCQQSCPLGLTRPPGGPTDDHATAL